MSTAPVNGEPDPGLFPGREGRERSSKRTGLGRMRGWQFALLTLAVVAAVVGFVVADSGVGTRIIPSAREHDVTAWTAPAARPLSDSAAAALVTPQPENRPANAAANDYLPTTAQLAAFHADQQQARAHGDYNPLTRYVTGRPGIKDPSTDELIQWVSHKWGIPTDWIRAEMVVESDWHQSQLGDPATVSARWFRLYPGYSRIGHGAVVYQSLGIAQEKWIPDGSVGAGTEPLRWQSTAFSLDYYAATVRYYYDGYCNWCTAGYRAGNTWQSIGAWFSPQPWDNAGARQYVGKVKAVLAEQPWRRPGF